MYKYQPSKAARQEYGQKMREIEQFCNAHAYNTDGIRVREDYHPAGREKDTIYIHAGKTRIIEIYNDLAAGYKLDGRGNRKEA